MENNADIIFTQFIENSEYFVVQRLIYARQDFRDSKLNEWKIKRAGPWKVDSYKNIKYDKEMMDM